MPLLDPKTLSIGYVTFWATVNAVAREFSPKVVWELPEFKNAVSEIAQKLWAEVHNEDEKR